MSIRVFFRSAPGCSDWLRGARELAMLRGWLTVRLRRIGHWGDGGISDLPDPRAMIFPWDAMEREDGEDYLRRGFVSLACLGYEACRICGQENGSLELSDGVYCWPEGLYHYVHDHGVGLPREFVDHVIFSSAELMNSEVDDSWWVWAAKGLTPP